MDAELWFLTERPEHYAETARLVNLALRNGAKSCIGDGCDLDAPCKRHSRSVEVVMRYQRRFL